MEAISYQLSAINNQQSTINNQQSTINNQQILGRMIQQSTIQMSNIKDKLAEEIADIEWSSLIPHAQRDALIVVHENLSLMDVGLALASDNAPLVQQWISQQLIHKPTIDELSAWNID